MNSEENSDEYGKNKKNDLEVIQNVLSKRNYHPRRVSFPESDTELVTGYLEPVDPLRLAINVDKTELLRAYELSCRRHNTTPIKTVVNQIKDFYICDDRINSFNLNQVTLTCCGCESLEEIFKRVQFVNIDLTECGLTSETASALFEMFEYYESAVHLNISNNSNLGILGWQACARYLKKSNMLEELETRDINLDYNEADCLLKPLTQNKHLQVLKLENCNLNGNSLRSLVNALTNNLTLKELYLADNKIGNMEAALLGTLLKLNRTILVLDLSNNQIQDEGVNHLVLGLCSQGIFGCLEMLVLWNNYLTSVCAFHLEKLLTVCRSLTILNVGCNNLHDSFVYTIMESLKYNQSIQRLGLQKTHITCNSAKYIADILRTNTSIERIDLRENNILFPGVLTLLESLNDNRNVIQIDLNETTSEKNVEEYKSLLRQINSKCAQNNENIIAESKITTKAVSRKISLTCQTLIQHPCEPLLTEPKKVSGKLRSPAPSPAPSPIPSPVSSPIPPPIAKSRFSVSRVSESKTSSNHSRFTVCAVSEPISLSKSVTSITSSPTVGFTYTPPPSLSTHVPQTHVSAAKSVNGCNDEKRVEVTSSNSDLSSYERIKPVESKTMSSIEKLLSIFQAPTNLFTKSSPPLTRQCDNIKHLPLTDTNTNKNINPSTVNYSDTTSSKSESVKENISPEHSLTLSSVKKINKNEHSSSCALDIKDKEVKNSNSSANISLGSGDNIHVKSHASLPLCSSSEDSDSGLVFDFSSGSVANATDTGSVISDDSAASSTSPPSVQSPGSESDHTDVTNNNKLRSTVSVTVTSTDSNTDPNAYM